MVVNVSELCHIRTSKPLFVLDAGSVLGVVFFSGFFGTACGAGSGLFGERIRFTISSELSFE